MPRKKTHEEFLQDVKNKYGDQYEILGTYENNKKKIEVLHKKCNFRWEVKPNVLLSARNETYCPKCSGKVRKDDEYFKKEVFDLVGNEYSVLSKYEKTHSKILFKHEKCGNEFYMDAHNFLQGNRCPKCQHRSTVKTTEEFKEEVYELVGDEYTVVGDYINNHTGIEMYHSKCCKTYFPKPSDFLSGYRCLHCYGNRKTHEEFCKEVEEKYFGDFVVTGEYVNAKTKVKVLHKSCGNESFVLPSDFLLGKVYCKHCSMSKMESITKSILENSNIEYEYEKVFDGLVGVKNGLLSFDFYLPDYNIAIECQGTQHEKPIEWFGGEEKFEIQQEHDRRKREYAKKHNIKLIEIWYNEANKIEEILREELPILVYKGDGNNGKCKEKSACS